MPKKKKETNEQVSNGMKTFEVRGMEVTDSTEAARVLGVCRSTIANYMDKGLLRFVTTPGGMRRPLAESVRALLRDCVGG